MGTTDRRNSAGFLLMALRGQDRLEKRLPPDLNQ